MLLPLGLIVLATGLTVIDGASPMRTSSKLNVHLVCHTHDDPGWLKVIKLDSNYVEVRTEPNAFLLRTGNSGETM